MSNTLQSVHPELVSEWSDKNLPLTPDKITFGSNKRVWWKGSCGHEWQASVKARSGGEKCPICSGARVVEGINDLATLKPQLAQEWSKKNELKPTEVSVASHKKVIWKCKNGHEWTASIKSRTVNGTGCPYCSHNKVLAGFNDLASQYPEVAAEWSDRNLPLQPTMVTAFANSKASAVIEKGNGTAEKLTFTNNQAAFTLKKDESVDISCLPTGWTYTVTETAPGTNFEVSYSINGGSKTVGEAASFTMAATGTEDIQFTNTSTVAPPVTGRNIQNNSWIMMLIVVLLIGIGSMVFFRKVKRKYH